MNTPIPPVDFYRYRVLMGALQRINLISTVRLWCIPEEVQRLDAIMQAWAAASGRMTQLAQTEAGEPDAISISDLPADVQARLAEVSSDRLFRASFSALPTSFKLVEIDRLVAPQRDVNLDYVDELRARIPGRAASELLEFCVGPRSTPPEWKILQTAQNQLIVTSKSLDLRCLGGFRKPLSEGDIAVGGPSTSPFDVPRGTGSDRSPRRLK